MGKWEQEGIRLVEKLQVLKDEKQVKSVCLEVVQEITASYQNPTSRKTPLATIRKAVLTAFPDSQKQQHSLQYFTSSGKGKKPRYQHLALKYLTLSKEDWDELGDSNRKKWEKEQQDSSNKLNLNDMTLEQLELDTETKEIAQNAMNQLNISLEELLKRSITFYSKTVVGKAKRNEEDLSHILTKELLEDKKYSTHPSRADELTKRAIIAIRKNNTEIATENDNRWCITQSAIATLTGSKPATIGKTLKQLEGLINDHNQKYDLNGYSNRKGEGRDILQEIDLVKLVPDGIDLNLG
ncbi:MAG: hypothetical protein AAF757_03595 [Cyanobacteria bacterium P01_D01_bin.116]